VWRRCSEIFWYRSLRHSSRRKSNISAQFLTTWLTLTSQHVGDRARQHVCARRLDGARPYQPRVIKTGSEAWSLLARRRDRLCRNAMAPRKVVARNQRLGRLEPAARSTCSSGAQPLEKPRERRPGAALNQVVVANSRIMVPLNVALTISRAAPTAMKPTNARTHELTKIRERIPNTIAAIPIRISTPLAAAELW